MIIDKAIADLSMSFELKSDYTNIYQRGWAFVCMGEYDKAIVDYTKEIELCHQDPIAFYERGNAHKALGKKLEAIADFEEFTKLAKESELIEKAKQEIDRLN